MDFLRRERDLLECEVQLLRRSSIQNNTNSHTERSISINFKTISEILNDFTGSSDNYGIWSQKVQLIRDSYSLEDNTLKALISSKLKGQALSWFHSKPEHITLRVNELMNRMEAIFDHRPNKLSLRREFEKRRWMPNEIFSDYHHDKVILVNRAPIPDKETIDYVVDGIPDFRSRNQARMHNFTSTNDLLKAFQKISLPRNSYENRRSMEEEPEPIRQKEEIKKEEPAPDTRRNTLRCYNCNQPGHIATESKKEKREKGSCYECGSTAHRIMNCPKREKKIDKTTHLV